MPSLNGRTRYRERTKGDRQGSFTIHTAFSAGLLVAAILLAGALAYEAVAVSRSREDTAQRALREQAAVAAWEFSRRAAEALSAEAARAFLPLFQDSHGEVLPPTRPNPSQGVAWFRLTADTSGYAEGTPRAVREAPDLLGEIRERVNRGDVHPPGAYSLLLRPHGSDIAAVLLTEFHQLPDHTPFIFGTYFEPEWLGGMLGRTMAESRLLPPQSLAGVGLDSVLSLRVFTPDGRMAFDSGRDFPADVSATDTIRTMGARFPLEVSLDPNLTSRLFAGAPGPSRAPGLLVILMAVLGLLAVSVTQLRRERLLARQRTNFVAGVTHQLRTPLALIRMFSDSLRLDRDRGPEERQRWLEIIDREATRLGNLVDNAIVFAGAESPSGADRETSVEIEQLLQEVIERFRPLARAEGVSIVAEAEAGVVGNLSRGALEQILTNLLDNAVKYGPAGQTVSVRVHRVAGRLRFEVEDQGPGVPEGEREKIFQPFRRLNGERTEKGGSGLGLAVVRQLVEAHGGDVSVEQRASGGARFVVELGVTG